MSSSRSSNLSNQHILIIQGKSFSKTVFLEKPTYSVGRHSNNSIVLPLERISRYHATLLRRKNGKTGGYSYWLLDGDLQGNKSRNGVFVNQKKGLVHELKHGDVIEFTAGVKAYYSIVSHSEALPHLASIKAESPQQNTSKPVPKKQLQQTLVGTQTNLEPSDREELVRLASFPELSPNPIIEIDWQGEITYLNPVASSKFPDLYQRGLEHPILADLLSNSHNRQGSLLVREVTIAQEVFEQYIHYLGERKLIRSYIFDFTGRKQVEAELRASEERYRTVVKQAKEGIILVDAQSKSILEANAAYCNLLGYTATEILRLSLYDLVAVEPEVIESKLKQTLETNTKDEVIEESQHRKQDGTLLHVEVSLSPICYKNKEIFCLVVRDITERKQLEQMLEYQAFHDALTGLSNRNLFNEQLSTAIANAERYQHQMAVMFLDLDRFKSINDTLGHSIGDRLLQDLAKRLQACIRSADTIARWGGDEFTILLPHLEDDQEIIHISQRILEAIRQPFQIDQHRLDVSSSIGIALYPQDGKDAETLLKHADAALYNIKEQGRNNYGFYRAAKSDRSTILSKLETLLQQAIEQQQLSLYYQPQININTGKISSMEALLRWQHPELGQIFPSEFLPVAEKSGLIVPIGEWVLKTACAQNIAWQKAGLPPVKVAVNLSSGQFQKSDLVATVSQTLQRTGLAPQWLELEITENSLLENAGSAAQTLEDLRRIGIYLTLDDFGIGYSSLGYLQKYPFQALKIAQSFVCDLTNQPQMLAVISAITTLGRAYNLKVIAEGVETSEQQELLRCLACEEMQGYRFSYPLVVEAATQFLAQQKILIGSEI